MEDIAFLIDQRSERKMIMGARDKSYEERLDKNLKKKNKVDEASTSPGESSKNPLDSLDSDEMEGDELEGDEDYCEKTRTKKSSTVLIELPKDIFNSPDVVGMLDRTGTTSRKAVGVVSTILKSGKIHGREADLSHFSLSRTTLHRKRSPNYVEGKLLAVSVLENKDGEATSTGEA